MTTRIRWLATVGLCVFWYRVEVLHAVSDDHRAKRLAKAGNAPFSDACEVAAMITRDMCDAADAHVDALTQRANGGE